MKNDYRKTIREYSKKEYRQMLRRPDGMLKYPFIVPGSQTYSSCLWDWDSWLADIAIRQILKDGRQDEADEYPNMDTYSDIERETVPEEELFEYEKGCILNFLENADEMGCIPIMIEADRTIPEMDKLGETNIHKPCLAQHAAFVIRENGENAGWLAPYMPKLEAFVRYYMEYMRHEPTGLYFWIDDTAIGVDNDPSTFYRPNKSSASVYLNCMMYQELRAIAYICALLNRPAEIYEQEAAHLKEAVNTHLWDERNGFYYSADLNLRPIDPNEWLHSGMPRHWDCLIQRIDCWSGFMVMWAGLTTRERAERMVYENLLDPRLFNAPFGVRTLAKTEKMYCIVKSCNPSCWLGPVWGLPNYMCWRGLLRYDFKKEADELAEKTIRLLGEDLQKNGVMHEYYEPETGEGLNNPEFQNWNLLVNNMIAQMEGRETVEEFT